MGRYVPAKHNLKIYQRATFEEIILLKNPEDNTPVDLTGTQVKAEMWNRKRTLRYAAFGVTVDGPEGKITLRLSDAETSRLEPGTYAKWDLLILWPDGTPDYILEGSVTVDRGYTARNS